ncbi:MAG: hypothetical protein QNJ37_05390, partial [Crocosphaera sp.]|nr:hypothetical protein [Crocosphaera sp.]
DNFLNELSETSNDNSLEELDELENDTDNFLNELSETSNDNSLEELDELENDTDNFLNELNPLEETVTNNIESNTDLETISSLEEENIDSVMFEDNSSDETEVLKDLFTEEPVNDEQDFLEMMPTSEENSHHLQETVASNENDPFADILESDSESNSVDPNDPFAELLGDGTEKPDEEFLNLLQGDENINSDSSDLFNQEKDSEWDDIFEDTSARNGNEDNPFLAEEMLEVSKPQTFS